MQGWLKTSFIDYPGKIASVFFYGGCNLRCEFCHNGELVLQNSLEETSEDVVIAQIKKKQHLYEGIVLTGGEPTLVPHIIAIIKKAKEETGLPIKLDTNGTAPEKLEKLISEGLVDYVAMDIKTSLTKYPKLFVTSNTNQVDYIKRSVALLKNQDKVGYEFRSTVYPPYFEESDLQEIADLVKGAEHYFLQQYNPRKTLIENACKDVFQAVKLSELQEYFSKVVKHCEIR